MTIQYKDLTAGPVEVCRDLRNKLLAHQAQKARFRADILAGMNFENRLKPGFEGAEEKLLVAAYDGEAPVGYVFADAETVPEAARNGLPGWAGDLTGGFYPPDMELPAKVGSLSNLYVLPEYRGRGIGEELARRAMEWLRAVPGVEWLSVYVSNGNNAGPFYERYGFQYTHEVLGGLIQAYFQKA